MELALMRTATRLRCAVQPPSCEVIMLTVAISKDFLPLRITKYVAKRLNIATIAIRAPHYGDSARGAVALLSTTVPVPSKYTVHTFQFFCNDSA